MTTTKVAVAMVVGLLLATVPAWAALSDGTDPAATVSAPAQPTADLTDIFTMSPEQMANAIYAGTGQP